MNIPDLAVSFYSKAIEQVHRVSSAEIAEAAKILENVYHLRSTSPWSTLKMVFDRLDIDVWEVIEAASTKPLVRGVLSGAGLGGTASRSTPSISPACQAGGISNQTIELAGEINSAMPKAVVDRIVTAIRDQGKDLAGAGS